MYNSNRYDHTHKQMPKYMKNVYIKRIKPAQTNSPFFQSSLRFHASLLPGGKFQVGLGERGDRGGISELALYRSIIN